MTDIVKAAGERYRETIDATREQRNQIEEDLKFSDPSDPQQWDETEKRQREQDPGGARPCLVFDQTGQYVSNVAGQVEQRPPALHAIPVDSGADKKVAEQLDGFFRHIEHTSRAAQHYARALTSAARVGVGYLVVRPEFTDRALGYQEPRISSEGDALRVVLDPFSVELDGSDAEWGQLITPFSPRAFERKWGAKAEKISFGDAEMKQCTDDRDQILVVEEWRVEEQSRNMVFCVDLVRQDGDVFALPEDQFWDRQQRGEVQATPDSAGRTNYKDKARIIKWVQMSGAAVLTQETEYPANGIGIVPVYGYVGWNNGRMTYCGIPRRAMYAQRAYNYHMSEMRAVMGQAAKAPWLMPMSAIASEQIKGLWDRASVENRAFLPYQDFDAENNRAINQPSRIQPAVNLQNHMAGAEQAIRDIQASIGMYQANLGAPSNESSGIAIESRKQQGEASTAHFPAHLGASLGQVGKLCMQMIPRLIDTKRQVRILGIDGTPGHITVDPQQSQAEQAGPQGLSINPNVGQYDVRVVIGASFSTQRQQAQAAYTEMVRANPQMMPAIAPLWAQTLDVPYADKLAQVFTAMAPPEVRAILQPNQQDDTAALKAENEQLKAKLQEAIQIAHEAEQDIDEAHAKVQEVSADAEVKQKELLIKRYDAETKRLQALGTSLTPESIQQLVLENINTMLSHPDPLPGEMQAQEAAEAEPVQGPGPDGSAPHEQAEGEAPEPQEAQPPQPSPDVMALIQAMQQDRQMQSEALMQLAQAISKPRKRVPVRDGAGNITHVVEQADE